MATEILTSFGNLQHELEEAKNSLKGVDESIKRLIGRDPSDLPPRNNNNNKRPVEDKSRSNIKSSGKGRLFTENEEPPVKRRSNISVFKRLSDKVPDDEPPLPYRGIISKVIVTPKEIPSREQALEAQSKDEKFKARNKRMFGALLGTLQKFQQEETKLKQKEQKRAELEKKIEEHEIKEKEEVRKERQELFLNRKKKQAEIKVIELKMLRMKEFANWEQSQKPRVNFILTKAKPHIHYLPRKMSDNTRKLLEVSSSEIKDMLEKKKKQMAEELEHIDVKMKKNFDHKLKAAKEDKEDHHTEDEQSHDNQDNNHNDDDDDDNKNDNENENGENYPAGDHLPSGSLSTNEKELEKLDQSQLEHTDLGSIQLPEEAENNGEAENPTIDDIYSDVINPDPQSSTLQSDYSEYYLDTINSDNNVQDNFGQETGE